MRNTANFTVFGGLYPTEAHSDNPIGRTSNTHIAAPLAGILFALGIGLATASGAVAALKGVHETGYGFQLAGNMQVPGVPTLREVLW
jgi:hypothetical protein